MSDTEKKAPEPEWQPPPQPVTWELEEPIKHKVASWSSITLRAPTAGDVLKATAMRGASGLEVTLRMISAISGEQVPYEALVDLPAWIVNQMSNYIDSFNGAPPPIPLRPTRSAA